MTPTKNQRRVAIGLLLAFTLFNVTLSQVMAEDVYKNDVNPLSSIYESSHAEGGYKADIVINPFVAGTYGRESGTGEIFKLDLQIIPNGIGDALSENGFKLDLIPQESLSELHNQKIEYVMLGKAVVGQGYNVTIEVVVSNQEFTLETSKLGIYALNVTTLTLSEQKFMLRSKAETTVRYIWKTTGVPYARYRISTYAFPLSGETFTNDNTLYDGYITVTIPGDVTGDGVVDAYDLYFVGSHWYPGSAGLGYNTNADINGDGKVDSLDLAIVSAHFGQSW